MTSCCTRLQALAGRHVDESSVVFSRLMAASVEVLPRSIVGDGIAVVVSTGCPLGRCGRDHRPSDEDEGGDDHKHAQAAPSVARLVRRASIEEFELDVVSTELVRLDGCGLSLDHLDSDEMPTVAIAGDVDGEHGSRRLGCAGGGADVRTS